MVLCSVRSYGEPCGPALVPQKRTIQQAHNISCITCFCQWRSLAVLCDVQVHASDTCSEGSSRLLERFDSFGKLEHGCCSQSPLIFSSRCQMLKRTAGSGHSRKPKRRALGPPIKCPHGNSNNNRTRKKCVFLPLGLLRRRAILLGVHNAANGQLLAKTACSSFEQSVTAGRGCFDRRLTWIFLLPCFLGASKICTANLEKTRGSDWQPIVYANQSGPCDVASVLPKGKRQRGKSSSQHSCGGSKSRAVNDYSTDDMSYWLIFPACCQDLPAP